MREILVRLVVALLVPALVLYGCANMRTLANNPQALSEQIEVGDIVEVKTRSGHQHRFEVVEVDGSGLASSDLRLEYRELESVQVERTQNEKAAWYLGLALAAVLFAVIIASGGLPGDFSFRGSSGGGSGGATVAVD
jgi:hypothetical protein